MKTPSLPALLVFLAALPAVAQVTAPDRCAVKWLEDTQDTLSKAGRRVADKRIDDATTIVKLKFGEADTCDAATWRHLGTMEPVGGDMTMVPGTNRPAAGLALKWRNKAAGDFWKDTAVAQQIGLVLAVNDSLTAIDAKAKDVVTAGDEVLDAAKALGFADFQVSPKTLAELTYGTSGGAVGALKPRVATMTPTGNASLPPKELGPTMRKIVDDGPTLGEAVVRFRLAVLAVAVELGRQGASEVNLKKRISGPTPGLTDLVSGKPQFAVAAANRGAALDDKIYGAALTALVGTVAEPALSDTSLRGGAMLDPIDLGLRNLIAVRSVEIGKIVAAARKRLGGKKISEFEVAARAAEDVKSLPANSLSAAVLKSMSETPEYQRLDSLYENNKRDKGDAWEKSPQGLAMAAAREDMKAAALSAKIEVIDGRKAVVYTQGGKKIVVGGLVPSSIEGDDATRQAAGSMISRLIVEGAIGDAKYQAVVAALGGAGQPGGVVGNLTGPETALSQDLPPSTKAIKDGAAGCKTPKDLVRNDYETYAARQRAAEAEMAGANVRSRNDVERVKADALAASAATCQEKKDAAAAIKKDFFDKGEVGVDARKTATDAAVTWCAADAKAIEDAAQKKIDALAALEKGDRAPEKLRAKADSDLAAAFGIAVAKSIDSLRRDYTTVGNARLKKLTEATGGSRKLTIYTKAWFDRAWPMGQARPASDPSDPAEFKLEDPVGACAQKLGLGDKKSSPSYKNPDNADNVDKHCGVAAQITKYVLGSKDSIGLAPVVAPVEKK